MKPNDSFVLTLVKGEHRYVFRYDDASRAECLRTLGRFASDPELSFTWYDAAVLSQKIREGVPPSVPPAVYSDRPLIKEDSSAHPDARRGWKDFHRRSRRPSPAH